MRAVRVDVPSHVSVSDIHADMSFLLFRLSIFLGARRAGFLPKFWIFGVGSGVWECAMCHDGVWMGCACAWARFLFLWVLNIHTPTPRTYLRTPGSPGPRSPGRRSSGQSFRELSFFVCRCRLMQYAVLVFLFQSTHTFSWFRFCRRISFFGLPIKSYSGLRPLVYKNTRSKNLMK